MLTSMDKELQAL